ncbi:high-potential iron-sulfur protein [Variovorax sp. J22R133]|uniref:high-potential iron-sulfur protein n=1 Tax=Variovorax brevis TaxID=3053503 RepID=UPI002576AA07|nr:high-potential iron-sulfur protein [Variovorax sp. J22R133]MDM0113822.1 high-potential iron-sulfur protein [Variovorax sp. J22R133]
MINPSRRAFVACVVAGAGALTASQVSAQAGTVTEADPLAVGLGYKADHTKADKSKFPNYDPTHVCSGCQQFQGKPTDATGPCQLFGNRLVAGNGWCSAWVKKA